VLLFILGTTDLLPARRELALTSAGFFAFWGATRLVQLLVLRRRQDYLMLGEWAF
jgi:hypothetical protein